MEWISVEDRLPETQLRILLVDKNGYIGVGNLQDDRFYWDHDLGNFQEPPTHWMPLPQPPQDTP